MKSLKIYTVHGILRYADFEHENVWFVEEVLPIFFKFVFYRCENNCPEKGALHKIKYLSPLCRMLWNLTEGNERKVDFKLAFVVSCAIH